MSRFASTLTHTFLRPHALALAMSLVTAGSFATEAAPYFFTWGYGSNSYKFSSLVDAQQKAGLEAATLAFVIAGNNGCSLSADVDNMLSDVLAFQKQGGRLIISFGGAAGTYVEARCTGQQMATQIDNLLKRTGVKALDFDVEGSQLSVTALNKVRNEAINILQSKYPDLYISFTLPVNPTGLTPEGLSLIRGAQAAGVRTDVVNIMVMDYGAPVSSGKKMGDLAIQAANSLFYQLKGIYTTKSNSELWAMVGITPMIGKNDVQTEIFTVADAQQVANFAKQYGVGLLAFWALQRDRSGSGSLDNFSLTPQTDYQFYHTFKAVSTGIAEPTPTVIPTPTPTVVPTPKATVTPILTATPSQKPTTPAPTATARPSPAATPSSSCAASWNSSAAYSAGALVSYNNRNYQTQWWTQGEIPSANTGSGKPWVDQGLCGNTNTITPAPTSTPQATTAPIATSTPKPTQAPTGCPAWSEGISYIANQCVSYGGKDYLALVAHTAFAGANWNPASTPTLWKLK